MGMGVSPERWEQYFCRVNGSLASILVDLGLSGTVPDASRPYLLWVWLDFLRPREDGLSEAEEAPILHEIEAALTAAAARKCAARFVGQITTSGRREMYFYGPRVEGFEEAASEVLKAFPDYTLWADSKNDPAWRQYLEVLYPNPRDRERIRNRHVIERLRENGDPLEEPRPVTHWIHFETAHDRNRFAAHVAPRGFTISTPPPTDGDERPYGVTLERVDRVDWNSINEVTLELFELASESCGIYDGWETEVRTDRS
jgi:hypothetical protein